MSNGLAELLIQPWAMEPKALEAFVARVQGASSKLPQDNWALKLHGGDSTLAWAFLNDVGQVAGNTQPAAIFGEDAPKRSRMTVAGGVARIPISGVLLKKVPAWLRWFGVDATSYSDIQDDIASALSDDGVKEIVLSVDSPGGQVAGVHEAGEAIQAARGKGKHITAEVQDLCASAAYWLASQAHKITAGPNAQVGSIGVYSVYVDSSKAAADEGFKVHVISSGPHKGAGVPGAPITEEQLAGFQKVIDGMAANFKEAVSRGRGRGMDKVAEWATGQVWLSAEATRMGLIDGFSTPKRNEGAAGVRPAAAIPQEIQEAPMAADPLADERKRVSDIKAAFPKHLEFALAHIEKGSSLLEAKVAFNEVLQAEADAAKAGQASAEQKLADAAKGPKAAPGAPPVPLGGDPAGALPGGQDFMARARADRSEHVKTCVERLNSKGQPDCCSMTSAMSRVSAENPVAHQSFVETTAPKAKARKEALGWK